MNINLPLALTIARVAAIPIVFGLFLTDLPQRGHWATVVFTVAGITDWLDGWLARRWSQTSKFGAFLDPVADKLLVAVSLTVLLHERPSGELMFLCAVIIGREITVSALREWMAELGSRTSVAVNWIGKWKTGFQMTAIGMLLWGTPLLGIPIYTIGLGLLWIAAVLTIWSMLVYLRAAWPMMKDAS